MNRVLLLNPPIFTEETYGKFAKVGSTQPFLGICYLAAVLKKTGFDVKILDTVLLRMNYNEILKHIEEFRPEIVGVTTTTLSSPKASELSKRIKERFPDIKLVVGGPHVLECTKTFFIESHFDTAVIGEGENTFLELCNAIVNKKLIQKLMV